MATKRPAKRPSGAGHDPMQIKYVATDMIFPDPSQPRTRFDKKDLIRLADSIKRYGIIQPLTVKKLNVDFKQYIKEIQNDDADSPSDCGPESEITGGQLDQADEKASVEAGGSVAIKQIKGKKDHNALEDIFKTISDSRCENENSDGPDSDGKSDGRYDRENCSPSSENASALTNPQCSEADNIHSGKYGISYILHGDIVTRSEKKEPFYELISGERRLRAARLLDMPYVPCIVYQANDKSSAELALVENLIRQDLNMFEEAYAIERLINFYGFTQDQIAKRLSMSRSAVANKLKLLKLTQNERDLICEYSLSERHARALLQIDDVKKRVDTINKIFVSKMNIADTEQYIDNLLYGPQKASNISQESKEKQPSRSPNGIKEAAERAIGIIKSTQPNASIRVKETKTAIFYRIEIPKVL